MNVFNYPDLVYYISRFLTFFDLVRFQQVNLLTYQICREYLARLYGEYLPIAKECIPVMRTIKQSYENLTRPEIRMKFQENWNYVYSIVPQQIEENFSTYRSSNFPKEFLTFLRLYQKYPIVTLAIPQLDIIKECRPIPLLYDKGIFPIVYPLKYASINKRVPCDTDKISVAKYSTVKGIYTYQLVNGSFLEVIVRILADINIDATNAFYANTKCIDDYPN